MISFFRNVYFVYIFKFINYFHSRNIFPPIIAITLDIKGALNVKKELVSHEDQENVEDLQSEEIELEIEGYVIKQEGSENSIKIEDTGNTKKKVNRTNIKTFSCDICEKSFRWKYYLKDHMITHVEDNNFSAILVTKNSRD